MVQFTSIYTPSDAKNWLSMTTPAPVAALQTSFCAPARPQTFYPSIPFRYAYLKIFELHVFDYLVMFSSDIDFPLSLWVKSRQHSAKAAATYAVIPLIICLGPGLESNILATSLYKSAKPAHLCLVHFDCKLRSFVDAAVDSLQIYKPNGWPSIIWGHDAIKFILHWRPCSCIIRRRVLDMLFKFLQNF